MDFKISNRLERICSFVYPGARLIDVGTDHGFVPIYLLNKGIVDHVWASDINLGPLNAAGENASLYSLSDRITFYLSNGLDECECCENQYDHIVAAGMGGELIFDIIDRCEYIKNRCPRIILQPMTMQRYLREKLSQNCFAVDEENIVYEDGKYYTIILCHYSGERQKMTMAELSFGKGIAERIRNGDKIAERYLIFQKEVLSKIKNGKELGNKNCDHEIELIEEIDMMLDRGQNEY